MAIAVNVEGAKAGLERLLFDIQNAAAAAMADTLVAAESAALAAIKAQTSRRSGDLEDGVTSVLISPTRGKVFNTSGHAAFVNDGTKPHLIVAKRGRALAFQTAGGMVFRRAVRHPGTKARPFVAPAMAIGERVLQTSLTLRVNEAVGRF